jgi:hypothetical protein
LSLKNVKKTEKNKKTKFACGKKPGVRKKKFACVFLEGGILVAQIFKPALPIGGARRDAHEIAARIA